MSVKVSVIVPCYNVEKYVEQCVKSICQQTLSDIEIICVNDGSTDNTLNILNSLKNHDNRIKIINKDNSGYGHSVNMGMDNAIGEYIGIVESDDFIDSDMYENLYKSAVNNNLDVARCCFYEYHTSDGSNRKESFNSVKKNKVFCPVDDDLSPFWQQPTVWINLYQREWLNNNNIRFLETPGASYQDIAFSFKVYSKARRFMMLKEAYLHYRTDNMGSSINSKGKVYCVCDEWNEIKRFLNENPDLKKKLRKIVPLVQLNNYKWNYDRIPREYKYSFLKVWQKELQEYLKDDDLVWERLSLEDRKHLHVIINAPSVYKNRLNLSKEESEAYVVNVQDGPRISVIVPAYNVEKYIENCLLSVVNQTYKNLEIICVNDGSTDGTLSIIEKIANRDNRIKVITQKNSGLSAARNTGLENSTGEWISFVDGDDEIDLNTYEKVARYLSDEIDLIWFEPNIIYQAHREMEKSDRQYYGLKGDGYVNISDEFLINGDVSAWNKIYRRFTIEKYNIRFPKGYLNEDAVFYWNYCSLIKSAYLLKEKLYHYFRRPSSIMSKTFERREGYSIQHLFIIDFIYEFWVRNNLLEGREDLFARICQNYFFHAWAFSPDFEKARVVWEMTSRLRRWDIAVNGFDWLEKMKNGKYQISFSSETQQNSVCFGGAKKTNFWEKIISLRNENNHKVLRIFTFKVFSRRKRY